MGICFCSKPSNRNDDIQNEPTNQNNDQTNDDEQQSGVAYYDIVDGQVYKRNSEIDAFFLGAPLEVAPDGINNQIHMLKSSSDDQGFFDLARPCDQHLKGDFGSRASSRRYSVPAYLHGPERKRSLIGETSVTPKRRYSLWSSHSKFSEQQNSYAEGFNKNHTWKNSIMDCTKDGEYRALGEIPHWVDNSRSSGLTKQTPSESRHNSSFFTLRDLSSVVTSQTHFGSGIIKTQSRATSIVSLSDEEIPDIPMCVDSKYSSNVLPDRVSFSHSMSSIRAKRLSQKKSPKIKFKPGLDVDENHIIEDTHVVAFRPADLEEEDDPFGMEDQFNVDDNGENSIGVVVPLKKHDSSSKKPRVSFMNSKGLPMDALESSEVETPTNDYYKTRRRSSRRSILRRISERLSLVLKNDTKPSATGISSRGSQTINESSRTSLQRSSMNFYDRSSMNSGKIIAEVSYMPSPRQHTPSRGTKDSEQSLDYSWKRPYNFTPVSAPKLGVNNHSKIRRVNSSEITISANCAWENLGQNLHLHPNTSMSMSAKSTVTATTLTETPSSVSHQQSSNYCITMGVNDAIQMEEVKHPLPSSCTYCAICFKDYDLDSVTTVLPCSHEFHMKCLIPHLRATPNCPTCNFSIRHYE